MAVQSPHILLASGNWQKLKANLSHVVDASAITKIEEEINLNAAALYRLGQHHFGLAKRLGRKDWRNAISRSYYGAYNVRRAVVLLHSGKYSQDVSDHKAVSRLPEGFPNKAIYETKFDALRSDRNVCDYDHAAEESDLLHPVNDTIRLVEDFLVDASTWLAGRGVSV
jgi:hypothetical protein